MKLTAQNVYGATIALAAIMSQQRVMPQRGKYLIARMHAKLLPEFNVINARRDELIKAYNNPQMRLSSQVTASNPLGEERMEPVPGEWQVPPEKLPEFQASWKALGDEEIEVDVQPLPLVSLSLPNGSDGSIEANELATLGELVSDE